MEEYDLAIIGNGFDLHYNQPTAYIDFFECIKKIRETASITEYDRYNEKNIKYLEFYSEAKKLIDNNFFVKYFLKYNNVFNTWTSFEYELENILRQFDKIFKSIEENNYEFEIKDKDKKMIFCKINDEIADEEGLLNILPYLVRKDFKMKSLDEIVTIKYFVIPIAYEENSRKMKMNIKEYILKYPEKLFEELINFSELFCMYLNLYVAVTEKKKINKLINTQTIINYNYTNVAEKMFHCNDVCYFHGRSLDKKVVLGINSSCEGLERFYLFFKRYQRIHFNSDYYKLTSMSKNATNIVIIGHSLDEPDYYSLSQIFQNPGRFNEIVVYFYANDKFAKTKLSRNLCSILGEEIFDKLTFEGIIKFVPLEN